VLLAPYLWFMGTQERLISRMMADRYASSRDGYVARKDGDVEVLPRGAGFGGLGGFGGARGGARRFTIVQRGGRFVIEEV
jgi:hypothetical protein